MSDTPKNQRDILNKLSIDELNQMQKEAKLAIHAANEIVLLSPTGSGKTLAFLLPIIAEINRDLHEVQCLILVPSRELALQIEQVTRNMGAGLKANAVYGGRPVAKDKMDLSHRPSILIGTPGRIADHIRRQTFDVTNISTLVLDEFDKSLEIGFEDEMKEIITALSGLKKRILTSATTDAAIPDFVGLNHPIEINYLGQGNQKLKTKLIISPDKDKLPTLAKAICHLGNQPGIIFCNYKDSIQRVSNFLSEQGIHHGCFHGSMEQIDREQSLIKFRNGSHHIIIATDLAARGIDIQEIKFIIHYHLPKRHQEYIHRNGRTARMHNEGTAYILKWEEEELIDFIKTTDIEELKPSSIPSPSPWTTIYLSGGRRDKISKGDIAGLCFKQGQLDRDDLGIIELKQDCAYVAVAKKKVEQLIKLINNQKLKKRKIRVYEI